MESSAVILKNFIVETIGFFKRGRISGVLKVNGKIPEEKDLLIIFVIIGRIKCEQSFSKFVGTGSRLQFLVGE